MSISPAKMILEVGSTRSAAPAEPPAKTSPAAAVQPAEPTAASSTPAPGLASTSELSTNMQIDSRHEIYYQVVDHRTGGVVLELPPETLRNIRESLDVPTAAESTGHRVDVKS